MPKYKYLIGIDTGFVNAEHEDVIEIEAENLEQADNIAQKEANGMVGEYIAAYFKRPGNFDLEDYE